MRVILGLMWAVVLFGCWTAQQGWSADRLPTPPKDWPWTVEGFGLDPRQAEDSALEKAREEVTARLRACKPPIVAWQPSADFIKTTLVASAEAGKDLPLEPGAANRSILHLKPPAWALFYRLEHEAQEALRRRRGAERMLLLAKVLAGVMVILLMAMAYVRIADRQRVTGRVRKPVLLLLRGRALASEVPRSE